MGTHPTFNPSTGPVAAYQPKTVDQSDASVAGTVLPFVVADAVALTTTQVKATIVTTNTFINALASSASRKGGTLQYNGVTVGFVFFGSAPPSDTTTSLQLQPGQIVNLNISASGVITDNVFVTGTAGDVFVVCSQ